MGDGGNAKYNSHITVEKAKGRFGGTIATTRKRCLAKLKSLHADKPLPEISPKDKV